jgi:hypothetical protein
MNKCSPDTKQCKYWYKHTNKEFKLKKCCRKNLMLIFDKLPYILDGTDWWLEFGTLLGFVREKKIIDWDNDLDVGINIESITNDNLDLIEKRCAEFGFVFSKQGYKGFHRIYVSATNGLYCDIWVFKNEEGIMNALSPWTPAIHEEHFTKNKDTLLINNKIYNIPSSVHEFLQIRYANWRIPKIGRKSYEDGRRFMKSTIRPIGTEIMLEGEPTIRENPPKNKY